MPPYRSVWMTVKRLAQKIISRITKDLSMVATFVIPEKLQKKKRKEKKGISITLRHLSKKDIEVPTPF